MSTYPDAPGHRNVETSIAAADAIAPKLGRLQRMAESAIRDAGAHGLTADELAARLDMDRWSIQPGRRVTIRPGAAGAGRARAWQAVRDLSKHRRQSPPRLPFTPFCKRKV